jgi:hypothetical protein
MAVVGDSSAATPATSGSSARMSGPSSQRTPGTKERAKVGKKEVIRQPRLTDDEVLADTPGVRVNSHAQDKLGRPAVEISRTATSTGIVDQTFENPKNGAVLETAFSCQDGTEGFDLYLSVTSSNHVPPNPYQS